MINFLFGNGFKKSDESMQAVVPTATSKISSHLDAIVKKEPKKIDSSFFTREVMEKQGESYVMQSKISINLHKWVTLRTTLEEGDLILFDDKPPKAQDARMDKHLQHYLHMLHLEANAENPTVFLDVTSLMRNTSYWSLISIRKTSSSVLMKTFDRQLVCHKTINKQNQTEERWILPCILTKTAYKKVEDEISNRIQSQKLKMDIENPTDFLDITSLVNQENLPRIQENYGKYIKIELERWYISCSKIHKMSLEEIIYFVPDEIKGLIFSGIESRIFLQKIPFPLNNRCLNSMKIVINRLASDILENLIHVSYRDETLLFEHTHPDVAALENIRRHVTTLAPRPHCSGSFHMTAKKLDQTAIFFPHIKSLTAEDVDETGILALENFHELESLPLRSYKFKTAKNFSHLPKSIKYLELESFNHFPHEICKELSEHSKLETLLIETTKFTGRYIESLPPSLKTLHVTVNEDFFAGGFEIMAEIFAGPPQSIEQLPINLKKLDALEELYLEGIHSFTGTNLKYLPKSLKRLHCPHCLSLTEESLKELYELQALEELDISQTRIRGNYFGDLPKSLIRLKCSHVESRPGWTNVPEEQLVEWCARKTLCDNAIKKLRNHNKLRELDIHGAHITGDCLDCLPQSIEILDLSECTRIDDEAISLLKKYTGLKKLYLNKTNIRGECFKDLPPSITELQCEKCMKLEDNSILGLTNLNHLERVNLRSTNISGSTLSFLPQSITDLDCDYCENLGNNELLGLKNHKNLHNLRVRPWSYTARRNISKYFPKSVGVEDRDE